MRFRVPMLTAATAALTAGVLAFSAPAQAGSIVVIQVGHVDAVDVEFEDGAFALSIHDESVEPGVERDPNHVVLVAKAAAKTTVPDDPAFSFLGAPGANVWILPETQDPNLLWPGLSTEELVPGVFVGDEVKIRFRQVIGPDGLSLFISDPAGAPIIFVDSEDGLPDVVTIPVGGHVHENWAFEKAGVYLIKYDVQGTLVGGGTVTSQSVWLKYVVLP